MSGFSTSIHLNLLQKGIASVSLHRANGKRNVKLCVVSKRASISCLVCRCYATTKSLNVGGSTHGNQVASVVGSSDESQRFLDGRRNDDFEMKLEELLSEIKSMIKMGNKGDAVDLIEANYEAAKEQMDAGVKTVNEAALLDVIALGYMTVGDFKMVESVLNMSNGIVHYLRDDQPILEAILTHIGSLYSAIGRFEISMLSYNRVLEIIERKHGSNNTSLVLPLLGMAKSYGTAGRPSKEIDIYHRTISILESNFGAESNQLVVPLNALGNILIEEGKIEDSESVFMRVVEIYTKLYGEDDKRVRIAMCSLANAKCAKGDAESAIKLYMNAIQVLKHSDGINLDDSLLEKTRIDLAELLHVVGRYDLYTKTTWAYKF